MCPCGRVAVSLPVPLPVAVLTAVMTWSEAWVELILVISYTEPYALNLRQNLHPCFSGASGLVTTIQAYSEGRGGRGPEPYRTVEKPSNSKDGRSAERGIR